MSEMPENPISPQLELLIHLHEYFIQAINVGFSPEQAIQLTMKLQELSTLAGFMQQLGNDDA